MIEKLKEHNVIDPKTDKIIGTIGCDLREIMDKLNEVVDAVNKHEDIIRQIGEWGSSKGECLWCDTLTEFNPEKPTISKMENVEPSENMLTKSLRMDKEFAEEEIERLQKENKDLSDKIGKLETELDRTRKALEVAKNAINSAADHNIINCVARGIDPRTDDVSVTLCNALEQITALEQKD